MFRVSSEPTATFSIPAKCQISIYYIVNKETKADVNKRNKGNIN